MKTAHSIIAAWIGPWLCAWREWRGIRPVHRMKRHNGIDKHPSGYVLPMGDYRICTRCGHTVPVKPRAKRVKQETEK